MASFTFIHAADLHLDCPFSGVARASGRVADVLYRSTFDAFDNLAALCMSENASFLLLAGDLFEYGDKSLRALFRFRAGVERLAGRGIEILAVHGNHDPLQGDAGEVFRAPGLTVFGADRVSEKVVEKDGRPLARVRGISYAGREESRNLVAMFPQKTDGLFTVGLVHANAGGMPGHADYAPCRVSQLDSRCDYWALGHVHEQKVLAQEPHAVYPGNTQARSVRETGPRGCCVVRVEDGRVCSCEFVPVDALRWEDLRVDVSSCENAEDATDAAAEAVLEALEATGGRPLCCRVDLAGRTPAYRELARPGKAEEIRDALADRTAGREPFAWVEEVSVSAAPPLDLEALAADTGLVGSLFSIAAEIASTPGEPPPFIEDALADLFQGRKMPRELSGLTRDEALSLLARARDLCAELLSEEA